MKARKSEGLNNFNVMEKLDWERQKTTGLNAGKWIPSPRERKEMTSMYKETTLDKILRPENLHQAYEHVKRKGGAPGVDGKEVSELFDYFREHSPEMIKQIRERRYTPKPVLRVEIPKDNGGTRLLGIPTVVDRVIQQAINQTLSPIYENQFSSSSYGFRTRRNAHMAITQNLGYFNEGYTWIVDIDLERFFDTVHHGMPSQK